MENVRKNRTQIKVRFLGYYVITFKFGYQETCDEKPKKYDFLK